MARVKYSPIISKISGSVGSATFQECRGGATLRNKPIPRQVWTLDQYWNKYYVTVIQKEWAALTAEEQAVWSSFLSFVPQYQKKNKGIQLTGYNLFLRYNLIRLQIGLSVLTSFDYTPLDAYDIQPQLAFDGGVLYADFNQAFSADAAVIMLKLTPVLKAPSPSHKSKLRKIVLGTFTPPGSDHFNIFLTYYERFGIMAQVGDKVLAGVTLLSAVSPIVQPEQYFVCEMV